MSTIQEHITPRQKWQSPKETESKVTANLVAPLPDDAQNRREVSVLSPATMPMTEVVNPAMDIRTLRIASVAGICNDDPLWEDFMEAVAEYRREQEALELAQIKEENE